MLQLHRLSLPLRGFQSGVEAIANQSRRKKSAHRLKLVEPAFRNCSSGHSMAIVRVFEYDPVRLRTMPLFDKRALHRWGFRSSKDALCSRRACPTSSSCCRMSVALRCPQRWGSARKMTGQSTGWRSMLPAAGYGGTAWCRNQAICSRCTHGRLLCQQGRPKSFA